MLHIEVKGPVVVQRTGDIGPGCCFTIPPTRRVSGLRA